MKHRSFADSKRGRSSRTVREPYDRVPADSLATLDATVGDRGHPLDPTTRELMESYFSHDFRDVRVYADPVASESAHSVDAAAYTVGSDIVLDAQRYEPQSATGLYIMAHELTHVAQHDDYPHAVREDDTVSDPGEAAELEAQSAAESVLAGRAVTVTAAPSAAIQRILPPPLLPTFPMPGMEGLPGYTAEWFAAQLAGTGEAAAAAGGAEAAALGTAATVPAGAAEAAALGTAATVPVEAGALGAGGALAAEGAAGAGAAGLGAGAIAPLAAAGAAGIGTGLGIQYGSRWLMNETGISDQIDAWRGISRPAGEHGEYGVGDLLGYGMSAADNAVSSVFADPSKPAYTQTLGWKLANLFD